MDLTTIKYITSQNGNRKKTKASGVYLACQNFIHNLSFKELIYKF